MDWHSFTLFFTELREGCQDFIVCNYEAFFVEVRRPLYEHGYELNPFSRQAKPAASSPRQKVAPRLPENGDSLVSWGRRN